VSKLWLENYPQGVPAEINLAQYQSITAIFDESCKRFGNKTAFVNMGTSVSYQEMEKLSGCFAAWLQSQGLQKGDRIALMMPNILQYPISLFGSLKAGLVVVNVNPMYTPRELKHQLMDSGAKAIVVVENVADVVEKVLKETSLEHVITTAVGDQLNFPRNLLVNAALKYVKKAIPKWDLPGSSRFVEVLKQGSKQTFTDPETVPGDIAFLQYTGGTTGVAKGAMLTHGNLVANMLQSKAWLIPLGIKDGDETIITALPLYHIFALTANCLVFIALGGTNVLITDPRNLKSFIAEMAKVPFTIITGVNTLFNALLHHEDFAKLDFTTLKGALGGGMAVQRVVAEKWKQVTNTTLVEAYGLTETSPGVCMNPINLAEYNGCIGLPLPSTECGIMNDDGLLLPQGDTGELVVRGPQVMKGYWQRPEETAKVMTADGWLRTGDIAVMNPDGYFKIVDRKKDMILVSGFNVFPNEIEDVIAQHPKVLEVAAIGIPDAQSGETVKVFVVKSDDSLTSDELKSFASEQLTGYKRPRHIEFRKELPKSNVGKILRRELRLGS
jgi:long-chain acyl-CoA synthetase